MATKKATKQAAKPKTTEAKILNGTEFVRSYNEKDHGKDYKKLAEQFAEKTGFKLRLK